MSMLMVSDAVKSYIDANTAGLYSDLKSGN